MGGCWECVVSVAEGGLMLLLVVIFVSFCYVNIVLS